MMWEYDSGWGPWLGMGFGMIVFWGLVLVGVIALGLYAGGSGGRKECEAGRRGNAERILADRFARGEIDEEEYRKRRELIRGGGR